MTDPGIPLDQAIERWTPEELWQRYKEIGIYDSHRYFSLEKNPVFDEAADLHSKISTILIERLRKGELIASGIALPLCLDSRRQDIAPELWLQLSFGPQFQMVRGLGLQVAEVLIREARASCPEDKLPRPSDAPAREAPQPARPAGRPSIMPMIDAEMRRRAASGMIEASLRREVEVLAMWAQQKFADAHVPKPKSIERKLGRVYRELKGIKRSDKLDDKL